MHLGRLAAVIAIAVASFMGGAARAADKYALDPAHTFVVFKTASIDTHFAERNKDLMSPDFLNVAEFPEMTFKSTSIKKTGDKRIALSPEGCCHAQFKLCAKSSAFRPFLTLSVIAQRPTALDPLRSYGSAMGTTVVRYSGHTPTPRRTGQIDPLPPSGGKREKAVFSRSRRLAITDRSVTVPQ
jgi:hypothetical protein